MKTPNMKAFVIPMIVLMAAMLLAPMSFAQANLRQPTVSTTSLLNLTWTAGTINNGGHAVAITAGSTNGTASRTDCAAPTFTTCGWLYADSSGTVANTTTRATAAASGNTILAMYESNGTAITKLSFPQQSSMLTQAALGTLTAATLVTPNIGAATGTSLDLTGSLDVGVAGTTVGTVVMNNATSGTITLQPTTGALGTVTATFPAASITVPGVALYDCGTANACSPAIKSSTARVFSGISSALNAASPAIATITGISPAFTSTSSYHCTATLSGASAAGATGALEITNVSSSSFTITAGNGVNIPAEYICVGF